MVRELAIAVYLSVFRAIFTLFKQFPQKEKTTFVASFGDNILYTVKELEKQTDQQVVILKTSHCKVNFNHSPDRTILHFESLHMIDWLRSIYHLATSQNVMVDNYYGFLAVTEFKPNVRCIQLWHAAGAIKKFGLKDPSIQNRSKSALKRFNRVYQRFDHVVAGSEKMASIFKESFGLADDNILRTGIPRSDFFFDGSAKQQAEESLIQDYPILREKKVLLYAPTFRDNELHSADLKLDIGKLYKQFKDDYVLFLRLHPAINGRFENKYPGFVVNVSDYHSLNHLLVVTDILITDYSSIPFEYSLLHKPMIFFAYDLNDYTVSRGFNEVYEDLVPGPIVDNTKDLIDAIANHGYSLERVRAFANNWNQYSNGNASKQLIQAIYAEEEPAKLARQL